MTPPRVTFFYDVVCPYAYLGSTQIRQTCADAGATLTYKPVLLGGIYNAIDPQPGARKPLPAARVRGNAEDLYRWAEHRGVTLQFPPGHPRRTVEAMRLLCAAELHAPDHLPALTDALYRAYWVTGDDITDRAVLTRIAAEHGLLIDLIDDPAVKDHLRKNTDEAVAEGVFGVPAFLVESDAGRRLIFGQDRMHFLDQALRGTLGQQVTYAAPSDAAPSPGRELLFYFDFSSPFTYLAATQIERVAAERGARLAWRPILLGGLFKEIGNPIVPIAEMSEARRRYLLRDMADWSAHWGVPFRFPSRFPMMTVTALRMTLAAGPDLVRLAQAIFRAYWAEDRDINDKPTLAEIACSLGLDGAALVEATGDPAIKQRLSDNTAEAVRAGAYGLPTFLVENEGGPGLFFGQDRLDFVSRALARPRP